MENELKNPSRNFRSEKFVWSEFLAEWKTAFRILSRTAETLNSALKKCKTEERDIHLILLSSFGQLCNRIITWLVSAFMVFSNKNLTVWATCMCSWSNLKIWALLSVKPNWMQLYHQRCRENRLFVLIGVWC